MASDIIIITQARFGSTRLPGKVLMEIGGKSLLEIQLNRLKKSKLADKIIIATTTEKPDEQIYNLSLSLGYEAYRGSEADVLDRYYQIAKLFQPQWCVRITSDCPLIDPKLIDDLISFTVKNDLDYGSNTLLEQYPDGQDIEVFKYSVLEKAWKEATLLSDREHVTPYIRRNSNYNGGSLFNSDNYPSPADYSKIRITVDEDKDFALIKRLIEDLGYDKTWVEYVTHLLNAKLDILNNNIQRNEGYQKSLKKD